ncbi:hypothetical protein SDC9_170688 [bioreactor metagenome]|uniref:Phage head-tail joining protein n=1 Tax=bioreactor metagenome TaxID=1076179 RepID=A0A645GB84_9ZZZZ
MRSIGEMKCRLKLYRRTVDTATGSSIETRVLVMEVWGARRDMSGREFTQGSAVQAEQTAIFTVRKPLGKTIDSGIQVVDRGQVWEAISVVTNPVWPGCIDLRCESRGMEGYGSE